MRISVRAKPNAKKERVIQLDETHFTVSVREPARENKANSAICNAIAGYFGVPPSRVHIISGRTSKTKLLDIL